ncbi:hypothetical protein AURANDRAFT_68807, partial [Aureococcus anophagefferens]
TDARTILGVHGARGFDTVIASDVLYDPKDLGPFFACAVSLMRRGAPRRRGRRGSSRAAARGASPRPASPRAAAAAPRAASPTSVAELGAAARPPRLVLVYEDRLLGFEDLLLERARDAGLVAESVDFLGTFFDPDLDIVDGDAGTPAFFSENCVAPGSGSWTSLRLDSKVVQSVCYDRDSEEELLGAVHPQDAHMNHEGKNPHHVGKEDTPAYRALNAANVLCTEHRRKDVSDIFTGVDRPANTDRVANLKTRSPYFLLGPLGCCAYHCTHTELFVPAGHVGFLMDDKNQYLFAQPGMVTPAGAQIELMTWRNLKMIYVRAVAPQPAPAGLSAAAVSEPPWPEPQPRVEAMEIFAGSGSMSRALRDGGASVVATCENDPRKAGALANSLPGVHNYGDIHDDSIVGHTVSRSVEDDYECKIVEVVRDTSELAVEIEFFGGEECTAGTCLVNASWYTYSVERFFSRPLVYDVTCADGFLAFTTQDTFKRSDAQAGTFQVYDAADDLVVDAVAFSYVAHWRPTYLNASIGATAGFAGHLVVANAFGTNRTVAFSCAS